MSATTPEQQPMAVDVQGDVAAQLRARGITPTAQRVEIATIVFAKPQHLAAEQILDLVNERDPVVSKATVYNTLGLFVEHGLVRELVVDSSKVFYDSNVSEHHHLFHVESAQLEDLSASEVTLANLPALREGLEVERVDIIIRVQRRAAGD